MLSHSAQIESILFWKGEPVSIAKIANILHITEEEVQQGILALEADLAQRGFIIQKTDREVTLATHPDMSATFDKITKEDLQKDLGKASLETLSIILYRGPIKRSEIDYIRGVNSQFILRNLLVRGLIERIADPKDERSFLYGPTFDLLSYLGVSKKEDLPEFATIQKDIQSYTEAKSEEASSESTHQHE